MYKYIFLVLFFPFGLQSQTKVAKEKAEQLKSLVKRQAQQTRTIQCEFTQYKHLEVLAKDVESKGSLAFKKPNWVKWEYTEPRPSTMLFRDGSMTLIGEGEKRVIDLGMDPGLGKLQKLMADSITGDMFNTSLFDMEYFEDGEQSIVHFYPKEAELADFIESFQITFDEKGHVVQLKMLEGLGDYTLIVFSNRKTNPSLPDTIFEN
ncbi:MAG: outer membrane lipoprotein carrier protein LolA [Flavobacteriaceae bacterium]